MTLLNIEQNDARWKLAEEIDSASECRGITISPLQVPERLVGLPFCNKVLYEVIQNLPKACGEMEPSTDEMPVALVKTSLSLGPNCQIL
jgi:hypothetical protein